MFSNAYNQFKSFGNHVFVIHQMFVMHQYINFNKIDNWQYSSVNLCSEILSGTMTTDSELFYEFLNDCYWL